MKVFCFSVAALSFIAALTVTTDVQLAAFLAIVGIGWGVAPFLLRGTSKQ